MSNKFTPDGMQLVCPATFPLNVQYCAVGAGDDPFLGRGKGPSFSFFADPPMESIGVYPAQSSTVTWSYSDWCYLSGGGVEWDGAQTGDTLDLTINCPASTVVPALNATGNCNLVAISATTNLIVPAPGGGAYTLASANPVPASDATPNQNPSGYWEWGDTGLLSQLGAAPSPDTATPPNLGIGSVVPTAFPGAGSYNLLTSAVPLNHFLVALPMWGSHSRRFTPMLKPKRILPQWTFTATLLNSGHAGLRVSWYLELGRVSTT